MAGRLPLVVILGATGTGKTKLSLELARKFGGEVLGADSMQVYKGLDILTAKATKEEQSVCPHHLIDILDPQDTFTVVEYRNKALAIIDDLFAKNKLPIIVGGTNYYIESILWKILIEDPGSKLQVDVGILPNNDHELPSEELHKKLKQMDPAMAKRLHPNNKRKILRSLEVLYQKGKKHSDIIKEQQLSEGGSRSGGGLRYSNAVVLWLKCEQTILDDRLNKRVDTMMEEGLVKELTNFHQLYNEKRLDPNIEPDYSKGIFQSIGFKEFHSYLMLNEDEKQTEDGKKKFEECLEQLKLVTRRYARKQNKWIVNRLLGRTDRQVPPVYGLDTTDVPQWDKNVTVPAFDIVQSFISSSKCLYEPLPVQVTNSTSNADDDSFNCEVCERVFVGNYQWQCHLNSSRHRKRLEAKHRKAKKEEAT